MDNEDARVTVKIRDLEGQSKFESIARELQVQLATIQAEKEAKIAAAQAMGEALPCQAASGDHSRQRTKAAAADSDDATAEAEN